MPTDSTKWNWCRTNWETSKLLNSFVVLFRNENFLDMLLQVYWDLPGAVEETAGPGGGMAARPGPGRPGGGNMKFTLQTIHQKVPFTDHQILVRSDIVKQANRSGVLFCESSLLMLSLWCLTTALNVGANMQASHNIVVKMRVFLAAATVADGQK